MDEQLRRMLVRYDKEVFDCLKRIRGEWGADIELQDDGKIAIQYSKSSRGNIISIQIREVLGNKCVQVYDKPSDLTLLVSVKQGMQVKA